MERLSERKSGEATRVFHYGDLGDLRTYTADGEGKTTTSYIQGPGGLVEQRSGEATSYPLVDGHGDVTAIAGGAGEVESRQSFDPWGNQLSGPSIEMGYLGAWERPSDPASGMVQMGARSYDPALGSFASEDPVLGHLGVSVSSNRYPYTWDNPMNRYDLNGRDVCGWTPFGQACAEDGAEDLGHTAEEAWNDTAPGRKWMSDRVQDFVKFTGTHTFGLCVNGAAGAGVCLNAQFCVAGNWHSIGATASAGGGVYLPFGAEAGAGPMYSNAQNPCELGGPFASGGSGAGEGVRGGVDGAVGTTNGNRTVNVYHPWIGLGAGPPVSVNAGASDTYAPCVGW